MWEKEKWRARVGKIERGLSLGKTVNQFPKINKEFSVKYIKFYVEFYFTSRQTFVNAKNIFRKLFYSESNERKCDRITRESCRKLLRRKHYGETENAICTASNDG
jgi:hypothetical protein